MPRTIRALKWSDLDVSGGQANVDCLALNGLAGVEAAGEASVGDREILQKLELSDAREGSCDGFEDWQDHAVAHVLGIDLPEQRGVGLLLAVEVAVPLRASVRV